MICAAACKSGITNSVGVTPPSIKSIVVDIRRTPLSLPVGFRIFWRCMPEQSVINTGLRQLLPIAWRSTFMRELLAIGAGNGFLAPFFSDLYGSLGFSDQTSSFLGGGTGGAAASVLSHPWHVAAMKGAGNPNKYDQFIPTNTFREVGFRGLFRGMGGRLAALMVVVEVMHNMVKPYIYK